MASVFFQLARLAALGLAGLAVTEGTTFSFDGQRQTVVTYFAVYAIGAVFLLVVVALSVAIQRRQRPAPALSFQEPRFDGLQAVHDGDGLSLGSAWILRTSITNSSDAGPAEGAHARLRFLEVGSHKPIGDPYRLRWCDQPQDPIITLEPNGYAYDIDLGLVFSSTPAGFQSFYVWSMDSQVEGVRRGDGKYRIDEDEFLVEITVQGRGFTKTQIRQVWPLSGSPQVFKEGHAPGTGQLSEQPAAMRPEQSELQEMVEREVVAIIDEGKALSPSLFTDPDSGAYTIWRDKTAAFLETVFGGRERQRFHESYESVSESSLDQRLQRLSDLRDRPADWKLRIDTEGFRKAVESRRSLSPGDQILTADAPPAAFPDRTTARRNALADWLGAREGEVRRLRVDLAEQLDHFEFNTADSIQRAFWRVNEDVAHKLRLDAPAWSNQFETNPDWFAPEVTRITREQFQEVVRIMDYTADQIAQIKAQVA